jgi:hypothetical protein
MNCNSFRCDDKRIDSLYEQKQTLTLYNANLLTLDLDISGVFLGNIPPYFFLIAASLKYTQEAIRDKPINQTVQVPETNAYR